MTRKVGKYEAALRQMESEKEAIQYVKTGCFSLPMLERN